VFWIKMSYCLGIQVLGKNIHNGTEQNLEWDSRIKSEKNSLSCAVNSAKNRSRFLLCLGQMSLWKNNWFIFQVAFGIDLDTELNWCTRNCCRLYDILRNNKLHLQPFLHSCFSYSTQYFQISPTFQLCFMLWGLDRSTLGYWTKLPLVNQLKHFN